MEYRPTIASSDSLTVEPANVEQLTALISGVEQFEQAFGLVVVPGYLEFDGALSYSLEQITSGGVDPSWMSHLFIHVDDHALIGLGGFKGPPVDGTVEIGYGIAPSYRRRGYATAAARILVDRARERGVSKVTAHTLAEQNPSTRVLQTLGFLRTAELDDPGTGRIWRWELDSAEELRATVATPQHDRGDRHDVCR